MCRGCPAPCNLVSHVQCQRDASGTACSPLVDSLLSGLQLIRSKCRSGLCYTLRYCAAGCEPDHPVWQSRSPNSRHINGWRPVCSASHRPGQGRHHPRSAPWHWCSPGRTQVCPEISPKSECVMHAFRVDQSSNLDLLRVFVWQQVSSILQAAKLRSWNGNAGKLAFRYSHLIVQFPL